MGIDKKKCKEHWESLQADDGLTITAKHDVLCLLGEVADLEAELAKHEWVDIKDRLPEEQNHKNACGHSVDVWCYYGNLGLPERQQLGIPSGYDTDIYHIPTKSWMSGVAPTHWMLIPALPKKEKPAFKKHPVAGLQMTVYPIKGE